MIDPIYRTSTTDYFALRQPVSTECSRCGEIERLWREIREMRLSLQYILSRIEEIEGENASNA